MPIPAFPPHCPTPKNITKQNKEKQNQQVEHTQNQKWGEQHNAHAKKQSYSKLACALILLSQIPKFQMAVFKVRKDVIAHL